MRHPLLVPEIRELLQGGDHGALVEFLGRLSSESLRMRFFATLRPDARLVDPYLDSNWEQRGALVGTLAGAFLLIPFLGVEKTTHCAVLINLAVGFLVLAVALRLRRRSPEATPKRRTPAINTTWRRLTS